jgi:hypothetical protein
MQTTDLNVRIVASRTEQHCGGYLDPFTDTKRCHFVSRFGVDAFMVVLIWNTIIVQVDFLIGATVVNLLWSLNFLKTYETEHNIAGFFGVDEKTYRFRPCHTSRTTTPSLSTSWLDTAIATASSHQSSPKRINPTLNASTSTVPHSRTHTASCANWGRRSIRRSIRRTIMCLPCSALFARTSVSSIACFALFLSSTALTPDPAVLAALVDVIKCTPGLSYEAIKHLVEARVDDTPSAAKLPASLTQNVGQNIMDIMFGKSTEDAPQATLSTVTPCAKLR